MAGKRGKNDANDAAAICEAAGRPHMRYVPIKTAEQQGQLTVHRLREGFKEWGKLAAESTQQGADAIPAWLSTHPRFDERLRAAQQP